MILWCNRFSRLEFYFILFFCWFSLRHLSWESFAPPPTQAVPVASEATKEPHFAAGSSARPHPAGSLWPPMAQSRYFRGQWTNDLTPLLPVTRWEVTVLPLACQSSRSRTLSAAAVFSQLANTPSCPLIMKWGGRPLSCWLYAVRI